MINPFDDMIDVMFEEWVNKFWYDKEKEVPGESKFSIEDFKRLFPVIYSDFKQAYRSGWLECERFYEKP